MKRVLLWLALLGAVGICAAVALVTYARYWFDAPNTALAHEVILEVQPGTGFSAIVEELAAAGMIEYPLFFKANIWLEGTASQFKAGEYEFELYMSPRAIMDKLVKGESIVYAVTIPEGWNVAEALAEINGYEALSGSIDLPLPAEGSLMPDTYHVHRRDARADVVERMRKAMSEYVSANWAKRQQGLPISTPEEWLVLASIVEKETGVAAERPQVASVFINRLRKGMPLQSDPTVVYGIEQAQGHKMEHALLKKDLEVNHPYNTYVHAGLPPAPICNPGRASLEAVLNPPQTDYLYFVATGTGGHRFARSLAEHNSNVAQYRAELRRQKATSGGNVR